MENTKSWLTDIVILTLLLGVLFFSFLGARPLAVPDEGRYAEIPREMLVSHDYVTPHINYIKYFEKPVFFYWMQAAALKAFGINEWASRFMTALMGLLGCLMTYGAGRKLYDRRTGWLGSVMLATAILYYALARFVTIDMTVSVFLTGCLFSFLLAHQSIKTLDPGFKPRDDRKNPLRTAKTFILLMFIFSALATLTKGMIGFIFPGMIIFAWLLIFNDWRNLKYYLSLPGILLWLAIVLPWHILVQLRNPEFFHFYVIEQHFARYFTDYANRTQPIWFMTVFVLLGFLPWTVFLFQAIKARWPKSWSQRFTEKEAIFLMLWPSLIFLFYQFSHSLLPPYVLPIFPPLAVLTGNYLAKNWENSSLPGITIGFLITSVLTFILGVASLILVFHLGLQSKLHLIGWLTLFLTFCTALLPLWLYYRAGIKTGIIALFITTALLLTSLTPNWPLWQNKSTKPLAALLAPRLTPNDIVVSYHSYFPDLPFYLQRRIGIVGWGVSELEFGMSHQNMQGWFWDDGTFWKKWSGTSQIFMFLGQKDYNDLSKDPGKHLCLLGQTPDNILVTNKCN